MEVFPSKVLGNFCHPFANISDSVLVSWEEKGSHILA